jgi:protein-tyrosine-phosphatase
VIIHFICRGNAFRSIIAEAYLNSLVIRGSSVLSSGTVAALDKARNLAHYRMTLELLEKHDIRQFAKVGYGDQLSQSRLEQADITVCLNQRVYDECLWCVTFPASPRIWSVADLGEPGRVAKIESERELYREEAYQEIVENVDQLISNISAAYLLPLVAHKTGKLSYRHVREGAASQPPARPTFGETAADQADPIWVEVCGRRMLVVGWTPGGAPYGAFEDEMDAGMSDLDAGECDQPTRGGRH